MDKKGVGLVVVLLIVGVFGVGMGTLPVLDHHMAIQEGQPATAVVQSTDIRVTEDDDGDKSYSPIVTYEYTVDGETYTDDNVFSGGFSRSKESRSWAEGIVSRYESGEEIEVHYRPRNPSRAYVIDGGLPGSWFIGAGYAGIALLAAAYLIRQGFKRRKQRMLMEDTPTEDAESLSMGPSEITGTAVTRNGGPVAAPFTDDDCIVATYEVQEYDEDPDDDKGSWKTIEQGVRHTPFDVDDGTGSVLVRPHSEATYDLEPEDWTTIGVDSSSRGPQPVQEFIAETYLDYPSGGAGRDGDRRYKQNLIRPDESVYVFGTVQPREDGGGTDNVDNLVIRKVSEDDPRLEPMYMISDDSETDLVDRRRWALWRIPVGIVFAVAGVASLVGLFGPLIGIELPVLL